jgi:hypothetical protein
MLYGAVSPGPAAGAEGGSGPSRRKPALILALAALAAVALAGGLQAAGEGATALAAVQAGASASAGGPRARLEMLAETSIRTDRAHPYDRMIAAPQEVTQINRHWAPAHTVNPHPVHPYHAGNRPNEELHRDFEHAPYGNHLPWEGGPEGALAKYERRPDEVKQYRFVVNKDGVVNKWTYDLPLSEYNPEDIKATQAVLNEFSPLPPPEPSSYDVAHALEESQKDAIQKSFRNVLPTGMFHDAIMDSRTGKPQTVPGVGADHVECPGGLFQCEDESCVAHISYCEGCDVYPKPDKCSPIQPANSGWRASSIGCADQSDIVSCGTSEGNSLFLKGEAVTGGLFGELP